MDMKLSEPRRDVLGGVIGGREKAQKEKKHKKTGTMGVDAGRVEAAVGSFVLHKIKRKQSEPRRDVVGGVIGGREKERENKKGEGGQCTK